MKNMTLDELCDLVGGMTRDAMKAALADMRRDTERLNWLEEEVRKGLTPNLVSSEASAPGLITDDMGKWAISTSGTQPLPEEGGFKYPVCVDCFVEPEQWRETAREAIDSAMNQNKAVTQS